MRLTGRKPKLTADQVRALREWAAFGRSVAEVARRYNISRSALDAYLRGNRKNYPEVA